MFPSLPETFKEHGVAADVRSLLLLRKSFEKGLINTLGDLYTVLKNIVVKNPKDLGPYATAFYKYFLEITINPGESLDRAVMRSDGFERWKDEHLKDYDINDNPLNKELVERYLDEIHTTTYDIQRMLKAEDILKKDDPNMEDDRQQDIPDMLRATQSIDYSDVDIEELLERMKKVMDKQRHRHFGGNHWLGQGGASPYGNSGMAPGGIRVGGSGGGRMARAVFGDSKYFPVDLDQTLNDNNVDAALAHLKGSLEESPQKKLDIENTIKSGLKQGGIFLPIEKEIINKKMQVILLVDNGGYSMDPYIRTVSALFKKMKTRFAHDLETYYFHNTIYDYVFSDPYRTKPYSIEQLISKDPNYSVFVIGDASMAPYELNKTSYDSWLKIREKFKKLAWLNPIHRSEWMFTQTIEFFREFIPMFPLTPNGIESAIREMNKNNKEELKF